MKCNELVRRGNDERKTNELLPINERPFGHGPGRLALAKRLIKELGTECTTIRSGFHANISEWCKMR